VWISLAGLGRDRPARRAPSHSRRTASDLGARARRSAFGWDRQLIPRPARTSQGPPL